ncbi:beta family protein [Saccharopolyspora hordei]|nr:beta family protein [Saccharopolyspora hordei]
MVAVRGKTGELTALCQVSREEAQAVRICVDLHSGGSKVLETLIAAVEHLHHYGQKPLLDVTRLPGTDRLRNMPGGPLDPVVEVMTSPTVFDPDPELPFTPVVPLGLDDGELRRYALLRESHDVTFGVRVAADCPVDEAVRELISVLARLNVDASEVELLVDVGYVPRREVAWEVYEPLVAELGQRFSFMSITVLGGSIPPQRTGIRAGVRTRRELQLWERLQAVTPTLRYGDYGVVSPGRPADRKQGGGIKPNPYLFYTGRGCTRYAWRELERGANRQPVADEDLGARFREVAQELVDSPEYAQRAADSWGDRQLWHCARGKWVAEEPQEWIAYGTSHHIAHLATGVDFDRS